MDCLWGLDLPAPGRVVQAGVLTALFPVAAIGAADVTVPPVAVEDFAEAWNCLTHGSSPTHSGTCLNSSRYCKTVLFQLPVAAARSIGRSYHVGEVGYRLHEFPHTSSGLQDRQRSRAVPQRYNILLPCSYNNQASVYLPK